MRRLLPLLMLPLLLNACVPALIATGTETGVSLAEDRSLGRKVDDTVIYTDITNQFLQADAVGLIVDVTFNIRYGRVMLTGKVKTQAEAEKAAAITWKAKGVQEVINELVVSPDGSLLDTANDSLIKRNLESRLLLTKNVWVINYSIDVTNGTAYLIGRTKDKGELNRVLNVARTTKGVKRVVSHLQINSETQLPTAPASGAAIDSGRSGGSNNPYGNSVIVNTSPAYKNTGSADGGVEVPSAGSISETPLEPPVSR